MAYTICITYLALHPVTESTVTISAHSLQFITCLRIIADIRPCQCDVSAIIEQVQFLFQYILQATFELKFKLVSYDTNLNIFIIILCSLSQLMLHYFDIIVNFSRTNNVYSFKLFNLFEYTHIYKLTLSFWQRLHTNIHKMSTILKKTILQRKESIT